MKVDPDTLQIIALDANGNETKSRTMFNLKINEYVYAPNMEEYSMVIKLFKGTVSYLSGLIARLSPGATRFETPTASLGIRGTNFLAKVGR